MFIKGTTVSRSSGNEKGGGMAPAVTRRVYRRLRGQPWKPSSGDPLYRYRGVTVDQSGDFDVQKNSDLSSACSQLSCYQDFWPRRMSPGRACYRTPVWTAARAWTAMVRVCTPTLATVNNAYQNWWLDNTGNAEYWFSHYHTTSRVAAWTATAVTCTLTTATVAASSSGPPRGSADDRRPPASTLTCPTEQPRA